MPIPYFLRYGTSADTIGPQGLRITAGMMLSQLGAGQSIEELLEDFPLLERDDSYAVLRYAAWLASGREAELA